MNEPFPAFRLSEICAEWAVQIKRKTGLKHWNEICRLAFSASLAMPACPQRHKGGAESSIEMTWKTFGGIHAEVYAALLRFAAMSDWKDEPLQVVFQAHVARGLQHMASQPTGLPARLAETEADADTASVLTA
jgi:DNA sulfur modification protein DndE